MIQNLSVASFLLAVGINLFVIGTPIALCVGVALAMTRAASARLRYVLTVVGFLAAAVLPFVLAFIPFTPNALFTATLVTRQELTPPEGRLPEIASSPAPAQSQGTSESSLTTQSSDGWFSFVLQPALSIGLVAGWIIGTLLLLGRELLGHVHASRARRGWVAADQSLRLRLEWPEGVPLYVSSQHGPYALGSLSPVVVVPASLAHLSDSVARQIARHELNHLRWRDPSVNASMRLIRALLWPSLPLWYLHRVACNEREVAADRAALGLMSADQRQENEVLDYAAALISIARQNTRAKARQLSWVATQVGSNHRLEDRLRRLMLISSRPTPTRVAFAVATLFFAASAITVMPVAKLQLTHASTIPAVTTLQQNTASPHSPLETTRAFVSEGKSAANHSLLASSRVLPVPSPSVATNSTPNVEPPPVVVVTDNAATHDGGAGQEENGDLRAAMAAVGYKDLTSQQLADMRTSAVSPGYVKELAAHGYDGLPADTLIRFKRLAVSVAYIEEMRTLGYDQLPVRTLARFRENAVSAQYIREIRKRVSGPISAEEIASLRFFGASTDFIDQLKALGYERLTADQLIAMRMHGVSIAYAQEATARGTTRPSADDLIGMRMRGN